MSNRPRVSTAFPSLNEAPHQLAVLEHEGGTLLALGTGCYVAVVSGELCEVIQLVGPQADPVSCADWFRAGGASLAAGAGCLVSFYSDSRGGAERWVMNGTAAHDQPVHALKWAGFAVWTAAGCALTLWSCSDDLWSKQWSCNLSQPAELMAPSPDGALLATAGRFDRLVKVWHRTQDEYAFSYLHHPHGLQSIEWRPSSIEPGRNVLLTLCRDGVARLWSPTHAPEREPHVETALLAGNHSSATLPAGTGTVGSGRHAALFPRRSQLQGEAEDHTMLGQSCGI